MSQKVTESLHTEKEEICYFILDIFPFTKALPELNKFWQIFKYNPDIIESYSKIPSSIKKFESLIIFLRFYNSLYKGEHNKAILYIENFINNEIFDEFFLLTLLFGVKENLDIDSYFDLDDQYYANLLKAFYFIKHNDFDKAYNLLIEINSINRLSYLKELLYLHCAIEKGLFEESENIFELLFNINKNNNSLKKLYIYYLLRKGEILSAQKYFLKNKIKIVNYKERTLFLYNLIESRQYDKAISFLRKEAKTDEELFLLARLYHIIGLLDEAFEIYEKIDDTKFPINKMKGLIFFQLGKTDEAIKYLKEEISKRFSDTDTMKIIRFLEIKKRWNDVTNNSSIGI